MFRTTPLFLKYIQSTHSKTHTPYVPRCVPYFTLGCDPQPNPLILLPLYHSRMRMRTHGHFYTRSPRPQLPEGCAKFRAWVGGMAHSGVQWHVNNGRVEQFLRSGERLAKEYGISLIRKSLGKQTDDGKTFTSHFYISV